MINLFSTIVIICMLCGCSPQSHNDETSLPQSLERIHSLKTNSANLTESEVKKIASALAQQNKWNLKDYESPIITFDSAKGAWWVLFDHKSPGYPGGHFSVRVEDTTKTAEFFPGK